MTNAQTIAALIEGNTGADGVFSTILPGVFLLRASKPTEAVHTFYEPSLCYVAQGRKRVSVGSFEFDYEPGAALAVSVGVPACGKVTHASPQEPFLCLRVEPRDETVADLRGRFGHHSSNAGLRPGVGLLKPSNTLEDALVRTMKLLNEPRDARVIWPLLEREICYHLLSHSSNPFIDRLSSAPRLADFSCASKFLRQRFRKATCFSEVAHRFGLAKALDRDFRRVAGMTVAEYLRSLRLQEARRLWILGVVDPTELASAVGYSDVSVFRKDYSATFHDAPDEHPQRGRRTAIPSEE